MGDTLFDTVPVAAPTRKSGDRRRTERQAEALRHGGHPLGVALQINLPLHPDAAPADDRTAKGTRCGTCRFRSVALTPTSRHYPKCAFGGSSWPRATHGAGTDIRAWWPACRDYEAVTE